ncbi:MAG: MFS transporter [Candidatus Diapherotrites archaeon]|nr:MFS transporter [Candidatus Diapherotrites archaeon]
MGFFDKIKPNVFVLGIVSLLTDISSEMIFSILPAFMSGVLLLDKAAIGMIEGIAGSTASVFSLLAPKLEKFFGKKKSAMIFGYGLSAIAKPFFALSTVWWHVLAVRFVDRAGKGLRGPPRDALIADSSDKSSRGFSFGVHRAMDTLGAIIGPLLAFAILAVFSGNFRLVFLLSFIPAVVALVAIFVLVREPAAKNAKASEEKVLAGEGTGYRRFFLASCVFAAGNMSLAFLLIRIQELGMPIAFVPLAYLAFNIAYALFTVPLGRLADRFGRKNGLSVSFALFAVSFALLAISNEIWIAVVLLLLYGIATAGTETIQRTIASELVPKEKRTGAIATYQGITGLLLLPASIIAGVLWGAFGAQAAFAFSALASATAIVVLNAGKK